MVSLKQRQSGFTIVELLIVIVIIGILATLVIVTFSGVQQRARDAERKTDINAVAGQLEAFYASNGYYPPAADLVSSTFRTANEIRIDEKAFKDPSNAQIATDGSTFSTGTAPDTAVVPRHYYYDTKTETGTACATAGDKCASYVIGVTLEGKDPNKTYTRNSN